VSTIHMVGFKELKEFLDLLFAETARYSRHRRCIAATDQP
jgi:hypothetical protein